MRLALIVLSVLAVIGCSDMQARGDQLVDDLRAAYPDQIAAIEFENSPPLDPPTLFLDIAPPMEPDAEKAFLCEEIKPRIDAAGGGIEATTSYGWSLSECP